MSELSQISAAEYQNVTLKALRRMLSYGPPLTAEERHDGFSLLCALAEELEIDTMLSRRLEHRMAATRAGKPA